MQEQVEVPDMRSPQIPDLEMQNEIQSEIQNLSSQVEYAQQIQIQKAANNTDISN